MQLSFQLHDCCTIQAVKPRRVRMQYEVIANRTANALQAPSKTTARSHAVKENVPVQIIFRKSHQLVPKAKSTLLPTIFKRQPSKFQQKRFCGCFAADTSKFLQERGIPSSSFLAFPGSTGMHTPEFAPKHCAGRHICVEEPELQLYIVAASHATILLLEAPSRVLLRSGELSLQVQDSYAVH